MGIARAKPVADRGSSYSRINRWNGEYVCSFCGYCGYCGLGEPLKPLTLFYLHSYYIFHLQHAEFHCN